VTAAAVATLAIALVVAAPTASGGPAPTSEPTTTVAATSTTTTTLLSSTTTTTVPDGEPPFVDLSATSVCYFGYAMVRLDVTALADTSGGGVDLSYSSDGEQPYWHGDVPPLVAGESWTELLPQGPYGAMTAEVTFRASAGGNVVDVRLLEFPQATCPLPPTAPTFTATATSCAGDDGGGAIEVAVTNTPGGPEWSFMIDYPVPPGLVEGNAEAVVHVNPDDGEKVVEVIDEIEFGDPVTRLPLTAGVYALRLSWEVSEPGDWYPLVVTAEPIEVTVPACESSPPPAAEPVRVATFNASLNRAAEGDLVADLTSPDDPQAAAVAEIIQRTRPDVVLLNEFDYDVDGEAVELFRTNYLEVGQGGADPIEYPNWFTAPVNTGVQSGFDLDNDGTVGGPGDAFGFGEFPGQYGMVVFSRHPILTDDVRTFQNLLWTSMPDARLPDDPATPEPADWYSADELAVLPLSSKSHWDVPIDVNGEVIHVLASHPTPPTFDGDEDRNGLRNADEIRAWADYADGEETSWIVDDAGIAGGLAANAEYVIVGDLNADPVDGDSLPGAIQQLLDLDGVHDPLPSSDGAVEAAEVQAGANTIHEGDPALDTADFADDPAPGNLRADYVLASGGFDVADAGVFWPSSDDPHSALVGGDPATSSDHRLVWADLVPAAEPPATMAAAPTTSVATTEQPSATPVGYGFEEFFAVPQLGDEPVRGTGCGGDGSIGEVIPDGYWRGFVRSWDGPTLEQSSSLQFDLICIYLDQFGDDASFDGWVVNNNDRTRTVPIAPGFFAHGTTFVGDEVSAPFNQLDVPFAPTAQAWIRIIDGAAVWAVSAPTTN
jgi:hypothetical protein